MAKRKASRVQVEVAVLFLLALGLLVPALLLAKGRSIAASEPPATPPKSDAEAALPLEGGSWAVAIDPEEAGRLMGVFFDTLRALQQGEDPPAATGEGGVNAPVFVTVFVPGGGHFRELARAGAPGPSVRQAAVQFFRESAGRFDPETLRVRIDAVRSMRLLTAPERLAFAARGLGAPLGFAVRAGGDLRFFLAPDTVEYRSETNTEMLNSLCRRSGLQPDDWRKEDVPVWALRTVGFMDDTAGSRRVMPSERGLTPPVLPDAATLLRAARLAGDYIVSTKGDDDSFLALWDPLSDLKGGCKSLAEQASAATALIELGAMGMGGDYLTVGYDALSYAMHYTDMDPHDPAMAFATRKEVCQELLETEASARVLEALCRFHHVGQLEETVPWIRAVARFLVFMQREDGRFELRYDPESQSKTTPLGMSDAVAPQATAALALALAARELNEDDLLKDAQKALDAIAAASDPAKRAWKAPEAAVLMEAILAVNDAAPQATLAPRDRNLRLAEQVAACRRRAQLDEADAPAPDLAGASLDAWPPTSLAAASDLDVFATACQLGPEAKAQNEAAARLSARYLMGLQFLPENSYYLPNPEAGAGGFRELTGSNIVHLQTVETGLRGLIKLTRVVMAER